VTVFVKIITTKQEENEMDQEMKWKEIIDGKTKVERKVKGLLERALLALAQAEQQAISEAEAEGIKGRDYELGRFSDLAGVVEDLEKFVDRTANETAFLRRRAIREKLGAR
jgi:hypothetical protein